MKVKINAAFDQTCKRRSRAKKLKQKVIK